MRIYRGVLDSDVQPAAAWQPGSQRLDALGVGRNAHEALIVDEYEAAGASKVNTEEPTSASRTAAEGVITRPVPSARSGSKVL